MAILIIIHYFWGKTTPPPKQSKFAIKHKKTINKMMDVCIILLVLLFWLLMMISPVSTVLDALRMPQQGRTASLHFELGILFITIIPLLGFSGFFVGFLSVFQSNLTRLKRIILLIISLLPMAFAIIVLLIEPREAYGSVIKLGLIYSFNCWIINGPAIIIGKHFLPVCWNIMCKLRLVSGHYPG